MKKTILLIVFTLSACFSYGQKIKFADTTNKWRVFHYDSYYVDSVTFRYSTDTVIHGKHYTTMIAGYASTFAYIREDTLLQKVFAIMPIHDTDTAEKLMYDYTLNLGDTLRTTYITHFVTDKDSVKIDGVWHRTWHLMPVVIEPFGDYDVIEGIGSMNSPTYPLYPFFLMLSTTMTCFSNNGSNPSLSHSIGSFDNTNSCELTIGLGVKATSGKSDVATVLPNPIDKTGKIVFTYAIPSGTLTIINSVGQTILKTPFKNQQELLIGDRITVPGVYFYRVTDSESGKVYSGKFEY